MDLIHPSEVCTKRCPRCEQAHPVAMFGKDRGTRDGLACYCLECARSYRANRATDPKYRERHRQEQRRWRQTAKGKEYTVRYRQKNRDNDAKYQREYMRLYRIKNPEKVVDLNQRRREWRQANPEKVAAQERHRDYKKRSEYWRRWRREWRKANPEKVLENHRRRRARKLNASGIFSAADWEALVARSPVCHWCGKKWTKKRKPTLDHVVALANGGTNDVSNSCCACSKCNSSKGSRRIHPITGQGILL